MNKTIRYLNTDLDLTSGDELTELAKVTKAGGLSALHVTRAEDGHWYATFETDEDFAEPEPNIAAMLTVIESLPDPLRAIWHKCTLRECNIGYDCGAEPWSFNQGLSADLLGRMAAVGISLRITLYPDH